MESPISKNKDTVLVDSRTNLAQSRLEYILSHTPIIFFSSDRSGILDYASGRFLEKIGLIAEDMVGTAFTEYDWNAEYLQSDGSIRIIKPAEALQLLFQGEKEVVATTIFAGRHFSFRLSPATDESGAINGMVGIAIDITEQKLVEETFQSRILDYKTVINALPVIVFSVANDGNILLAEGNGLERLGLHPGEGVGETIYERAQSRPEVLEAFAKALKGEETFYQNLREGKFLETRMYPKFKADGSVGEVLGIVYDISDRLAYESKIRESEENYRMLFRKNPQVMILFDRKELKVVAVNEMATYVYGYSQEEFVGLPVLELRPPEERAEVKFLIQSLPDGPNFFSEIRHVKKNGDPLYLDLLSSLMRFEGRDCVLLSGTDVSARVQAEKENRFNLAVLAQVTDAVIALDSERRIVYCNKPAEILYGKENEDFRGRLYTDLFTPEWFSEEDRQKATIDWEEKGASKVELYHVLADGRKIAVETSFKKFQNKESDLPGVIMVNRDISEKFSAREALQQALKTLEKTNKELEQFAYVASHDLQEPLRTIASYLQLLERKFQADIKPEMQEFIRVAVEAAKRQQGLIESLLSYSRIGSASLKKEKTDLSVILEEALRDLSSMLAESSAKVLVDEKLPIVNADSDQMRRLFTNLISNGIKFHLPERPPEIRIGFRKLTGFWEFEFSDNGIGMESKYFDRIFIIFQKLHPRSQYPGTGIGLSLCKKIVDNHGGRIWVKSRTGEGSQFFFTLPENVG